MITLSQLVKKNKASGGHFFDDATLACWKQTLSDFTIIRQNEHHLVMKQSNGKQCVFDVDTGRVNNVLKPENIVTVGDEVDVTPKPNDVFAHAFTGTVISTDGSYIRVRDQEDDAWDCDADQVVLTDEA